MDIAMPSIFALFSFMTNDSYIDETLNHRASNSLHYHIKIFRWNRRNKIRVNSSSSPQGRTSKFY